MVKTRGKSRTIIPFGKLAAKIKGLSYSRFLLVPGELFYLLREPRNQYDDFAVAVRYVKGNGRIGYLEREVAAVIAPLMDGKKVVIDVTVPLDSSNGCVLQNYQRSK